MPFSEQNPKKPTQTARSGDRQLSYQETYICPICRHGQITGLTLMDAFACDFCRHIFTANLPEQSVQVVDSSQPMSWRWNGRNWQVAYQDDFNLTMMIWLIGVLLVGLPSAIVWLSAYTFPPLPGSPWAWFPMVWVGCTFLVHLVLVLWVMAEHYQLPWYVASKVRLRSLLGQR
ncbi:hypothetical protein H6G89_11150 [Oscillatoria sp. FACHB-1407]|uniref:hypothetical protein n=1 Tax=Oscillatoria sp. FACHB-1407 TaxID=2692847 RepID=UPI001688B92E|nr:hypothetical protein [Oscillatoria sp. FACHB-1407]MBD2461607.1 hypothetical protein [Oscillatoria sp. FACHB-1407]